ncbi:uncharacterized protein LOC142814382 [Rhipicephalus microplus]|uniref:uncharacterized protein LOC142814382 n=1 Tax=Rhipicephalus microplus TaxID=6941 RepID=UPI003F6B8CA3
MKAELLKIKEEMKQEMKSFRDSLERDLRNEIRELKNDQRQMTGSLDFAFTSIEEHKKKLDDVITKNRDLESKNAALRAECKCLESKGRDLDTRLVLAEQYSRKANLEIQGVLKQDNESVTNIVSNIGSAINEQITAVASSLHILHLSVPKWVQNGTEDSAVLDCVYNANREDEHLVIKWFLNDDPQPIYQWIPELNKWFVSSRLKDRINLDYSLSNGNSFTKFRALNLVRPTTELSGRYSCHVMSLAGQDSESKLMTVYAPPKMFDFTYQRVSAHVTNLSCEVEGVFPQPTLFLYQSSGRDPVSRPVASAPARMAAPAQGAAGYHVCLTYALDSRALDESGHVEYVFECVLAITETNYRQQRRLELEPGRLVSSASQLHTVEILLRVLTGVFALMDIA